MLKEFLLIEVSLKLPSFSRNDAYDQKTNIYIEFDDVFKGDLGFENSYREFFSSQTSQPGYKVLGLLTYRTIRQECN